MASQSTPEQRATGDSDRPSARHSIAPRVFIPAAGIILAFVIFAVVWSETAEGAIGTLQTGIVAGFSWYYVILVSAFVVFAIWVG